MFTSIVASIVTVHRESNFAFKYNVHSLIHGYYGDYEAIRKHSTPKTMSFYISNAAVNNYLDLLPR